jgi:hypothetical protein
MGSDYTQGHPNHVNLRKDDILITPRSDMVVGCG